MAECTWGPRSACFVRVGTCRVQLPEHQESFEGEATEVPKVELLKEAVSDCDTDMDCEETRCMSDLVPPLQLANIANGRPMKDVRLEFVDWARDGRYQLTLEGQQDLVAHDRKPQVHAQATHDW